MTDPGINWSYKQKKYKVLNILVILLSEDSDRDDDYEDAAEGNYASRMVDPSGVVMSAKVEWVMGECECPFLRNLTIGQTVLLSNGSDWARPIR